MNAWNSTASLRQLGRIFSFSSIVESFLFGHASFGVFQYLGVSGGLQSDCMLLHILLLDMGKACHLAAYFD